MSVIVDHCHLVRYAEGWNANTMKMHSILKNALLSLNMILMCELWTLELH